MIMTILSIQIVILDAAYSCFALKGEKKAIVVVVAATAVSLYIQYTRAREHVSFYYVEVCVRFFFLLRAASIICPRADFFTAR